MQEARAAVVLFNFMKYKEDLDNETLAVRHAMFVVITSEIICYIRIAAHYDWRGCGATGYVADRAHVWHH
jgi:hypothetical protein